MTPNSKKGEKLVKKNGCRHGVPGTGSKALLPLELGFLYFNLKEAITLSVK